MKRRKKFGSFPSASADTGHCQNCHSGFGVHAALPITAPRFEQTAGSAGENPSEALSFAEKSKHIRLSPSRAGAVFGTDFHGRNCGLPQIPAGWYTKGKPGAGAGAGHAGQICKPREF